MKIGTPEWKRDDALRRVSNNLTLELGRIREQKSGYESGARQAAEFERQILDDLESLRRVRAELRKAAS